MNFQIHNSHFHGRKPGLDKHSCSVYQELANLQGDANLNKFSNTSHHVVSRQQYFPKNIFGTLFLQEPSLPKLQQVTFQGNITSLDILPKLQAGRQRNRSSIPGRDQLLSCLLNYFRLIASRLRIAATDLHCPL